MHRQDLQLLVDEFSDAVIGQNKCIELGDWKEGNRLAARYITASKRLHHLGDDGIDALCTLLEHDDTGVRGVAAAFLLATRTEQAVATLKPIATGEGLAAIGAQQTLERYQRGELEIDMSGT